MDDNININDRMYIELIKSSIKKNISFPYNANPASGNLFHDLSNTYTNLCITANTNTVTQCKDYCYDIVAILISIINTYEPQFAFAYDAQTFENYYKIIIHLVKYYQNIKKSSYEKLFDYLAPFQALKCVTKNTELKSIEELLESMIYCNDKYAFIRVNIISSFIQNTDLSYNDTQYVLYLLYNDLYHIMSLINNECIDIKLNMRICSYDEICRLADKILEGQQCDIMDIIKLYDIFYEIVISHSYENSF